MKKENPNYTHQFSFDKKIMLNVSNVFKWKPNRILQLFN